MAGGELASTEIYDALLDDDLFAALPQRLAESFGGRSSLLHWHHSCGSASVLAHSGYFSDAQLAVYESAFAPMDPWAQAAAQGQRPNEAMDLALLVPVESFVRTAFYNDYIRAMGDDTARCMGVMVRNDFGQGMIAIQSGRSRQGFTAAQIAGMDHAAGHLRRLLAVRGKLAGVERRADAARRMLDALPQAALLVRADGRILEANRQAEMLLAEGRLLYRKAGGIGAPQGDAALLAAIAGACDPRLPTAGAAATGGGVPPVLAMPVRDSGGARCALLLVDSARAPDGVARLKGLYGLTDAEAAVAVRLAAGKSIGDIAEARGVSVATVRSQLGVLRDKMGLSRQAEIALATFRIVG